MGLVSAEVGSYYGILYNTRDVTPSETELYGCNYILGDLFKCPFLASFLGYIPKSIIAGSSVNLTGHNISRKNLVSVVWKIRTIETHCLLSYRADNNMTFRNCSKSMDWKCSPDTDCAIQIQKVTLKDEGCYICETASNEGHFMQNYTLTVLGK